MNINQATSKPSPITELLPDFANNADEQLHTPKSGAVSHSSGSESLVNRSVIQTKKISGAELRDLILVQIFSNDVHYHVEGDLSLEGCTNLEALPENLSVEGNLELTGCTHLKALPENLYVGQSLVLNYCVNLRALPEKLVLGGDLNLLNCDSLGALPESLSVKGCLDLTLCDQLTTLPGKLSVGGDLYLMSCTRLTTLPDNLSFGGAILDLRGCISLTALPNWISTLGPTRHGTKREVLLQGTGLSDALIDRLRTATAQAQHIRFRFYFFGNAGKPEQEFSSPKQGFVFWRKLALTYAEIPELDLKHDQAANLTRFLGRLTTTVDYQNQTTRPILAQRVMNTMSLITSDDHRVRGDALRCIDYGLSSYDDRVILTLDDLEMLQLLITAEALAIKSLDPGKLSTVGLQMMRLDKVKQIARDHMKTLNWVDQVEVELAFRIGVCQQLELPGVTRDVFFRGCAYVSDQDIDDAIEKINNYCSNGDNLNDFFVKWTPWQKFECLKTEPSFDQLKSAVVALTNDCAIRCEKNR